MAWYNLFGCFSSALGALCCGGIIVHLNSTLGFGLLVSYRLTMAIYAFIKVRQAQAMEVPGLLPKYTKYLVTSPFVLVAFTTRTFIHCSHIRGQNIFLR